MTIRRPTDPYIDGPRPRWRDTTSHQVMAITHPLHTPDNKVAGDFDKSRCVLRIEKHAEVGWAVISLEETTTSHSGRTQTRSISMTIRETEWLQRIADLITAKP